MNRKFVRDEFDKDLIDWSKYHFGENLVALGLFDPSKVDANYPRGDVNVLIVLNMAPENERERYEVITEMLVRNLVPGVTLKSRVQTVGELKMLSNLKLPLLEIYLRDIDIIHDPQKALESARANLT